MTARTLTSIGAGAAVLAATLQALAVADPFPNWTTDPWVTFTPGVGFGPTASVLLNALGVLGASLCLVGSALERRSVRAWAVIAATLGLVPMAFHAFDGGVSIDDLRLGSAWAACVLAAVALSTLPARATLRAVALAVTLGLLGAVVAKSAGQVFDELPQTIRNFDRQSEAFFQSRGWDPEGPQARAFERRLRQPNATAWFAMPNVAASVMGLGVIVGVGLTIGARPGRPAPRLVALAAGLACAAALWTTGARAAIALTLAGLAAAVALPLFDRVARDRSWLRGRAAAWLIGLGAPACVGIGLALRGLLGERLGELSILFRTQYAVGAARIAADHPLLGVGPDGFQSVYPSVKVPLSPEDVASAHSTPLDYIATLGLGGWAWVALLLAAFVLLARVVLGASPADPGEAPRGPIPIAPRARRYLVLLAGVLPIIAAYTETEALTPVGVLVRIAAGVAAGSVTWAAFSLFGGPRFDRILAVGVLAVMLHGLLDVGFVWPNAAPWLGVLVGLTVASASGAGRSPRAWSIGAGAIWGLAAAGAAAAAIAVIGPWESRLRDAAAPFAAVALAREATPNAEAADATPGLRREAASRLSALLGRPVPPDADSLARAAAEAAGLAGPRARVLLAEAADRAPSHLPTARAYGRAWAVWPADDAGLTPVAAAERVLDRRRPTGASDWAWLARAHELEARLRTASENASRPRQEARLEALERAAAAAPHDWTHAERLALAYSEVGRADEARRWAREALARVGSSRLDPLRQPSEAARSVLEKIAQEP